MRYGDVRPTLASTDVVPVKDSVWAGEQALAAFPSEIRTDPRFTR